MQHQNLWEKIVIWFSWGINELYTKILAKSSRINTNFHLPEFYRKTAQGLHSS